MVHRARAPRCRGSKFAVAFAATLLGLALPASALIFVPTVRSASPTARVRLFADGVERELHTTALSVAQALAEAHVLLGPEDQVAPSLIVPLVEGMVIHVSRVTHEEVTKQEKVAYRTVYKRLAGRYQKLPQVVSRGKAGVSRRTYDVTYRDGVEIGRCPVREVVVQAPVHQVVALRQVASLPSRGFFGGRRILQMIATAYDPGPLSCGPRANGRTAIGMRAGHGVVAVDPNVIPLRARLYIDGYGHAIAGDTGGAIKGHRIDLGYASRSQALRFGRRKVTVRILD